MLDTTRFIARAHDLYGYDNFVCDTSGSICEVVDAENPGDPVMTALSENLLIVWIKGAPSHRDALIRRFDRAPKPMYYPPDFLNVLWDEFTAGRDPATVDPDAFLRFGYARLLDHRQPRYEAMAKWGVTVMAEDVAKVTTPAAFADLMATALDRQPACA